MSTEIEQRVVQMKFDNAKFEAGVQTTLTTLGNLRKSMNFDGIGKGFSNITAAAKNVDLSSIEGATESVSLKFDAMQIFAINMMSRISNYAITTGKNIIKAFTIDPIKTGFQEYELKMTSVQTIMASTGATIGEVTRYLNELNEYSDRTIYSFADMTTSIGKFTNAGVKLDDAVAAIKGISNEAAISGANANEASRAMYNFAQAMSIGYVGLQDWKSIEYANMGTQAFKNELIATAEAMGTLVRSGEGWVSTTTDMNGKTSDLLTATTGFTASLSHQWMTADVLTETLKKYADETTDLGKSAYAAAQDVKTFSQMMDSLKEAAQSGWAATWEILVGDLEEAKSLYTPINNILSDFIGKMSDARNELLQGWKALGGRDDLIKSFSNIYKTVSSILGSIGKAFREVFPKTTSDQLHSITNSFLKLTEAIIPSQNTLDAFTNVFKTLFLLIKPFTTALTIPLKFIPSLTDLFIILGSVLSKVAGFFTMITSAILEFVQSGQFIPKVFDALAWAVVTATSAIRDFITNFQAPMNIDEFLKSIPGFEKIAEYASKAKERVIDFGNEAIRIFKEVDTQALKNNAVKTLTKSYEFVIDLYTGMQTKVAQAWKFATDVMKEGVSQIKSFIEWVDWKQVFDFLAGTVASIFFLDLGAAIKHVSRAFENVGGAFKNIASTFSVIRDIGKSISGLFDTVGDSLKEWQKSLRADNLMKIATAIGVIAAAIYVLSTVDTDKLIPALVGVGGVMIALTGASIAISKWSEDGGLKGLMGLGVAVLLIAKAVKTLSDIPAKDMTVGMAAVIGLITAMGVYTGAMSKLKAQITTGALVLVAFSASIVILSSAVMKLTNIDPTSLATAIAGIVALSLAVATSAKILSKQKDADKGALKLMAFASSIKILAKAVKILADVPLLDMVKGLAGIGVLLAEMALFTNKIDNKQMISVSIGMNIVAAALLAMTIPIAIFGHMNLLTISQGLLTIGAALLVLSTGLNKMPKNLPSIGLGLLIVANALTLMSAAMGILGSFKWSTISKSLFGFGLALSALSSALNSMIGTLPASAALVIASSALIVLAGALGIMGSLSLGTIIIGLLGFSGALAILTTNMFILTPLVPVLTSFALAIVSTTTALLIGATALAVFGVALTTIAAGLVALNGLGSAMMKTIINLAKSLLECVPFIAKAAADLVVGFIEGLSRGKNALRRAFVDLILVTLEAANDVLPAAVETVLNVLDKVLESLAKHTEPIVTNLAKFLIGLIRGVRLHIPELVDEAVQLVVTLFKSIYDALARVDTADLLKVVVGMGITAGIMAICASVLPLLPAAAASVAAMGGIILELVGVLGLLGGIAIIPGVKWLVTEGGDILGILGGIIGKFIGGLMGGVTEGITSALPVFGTHLAGFITNAQPFFDGVKSIDSSTAKGVNSLAKAVTIITASSFIDGILSFFSLGKSSLVRFGEQLAEFAPYYRKYADTMSGVSGAEVEATANAAKSLAQMALLAPRQNGLVSLLLGKKDLVEFGKSLAEFGPNFAKYTKSVTGINNDAVSASATSASSIAEFSKLVPNQGGLVALICGDNTLAKFGKGLAEFGPHLAKYAKSVTGLKADAVVSSASAASSIAEFAKLIPNKGGLVALFTGDNSLSAMGRDLAKFGPSLAKYSESVADVKVSSIYNSVNASTSLAELAASMPSGRFMLAAFGGQIEDLGKSLAKYFDRINNIQSSKISSSINAINELVKLANVVEGTNTFAIGEFSMQLGMISTEGINSFVNNFANSHDRAKAAVDGMINASISSVTTIGITMTSIGSTMMQNLIASIQNGSAGVVSAMTTMCASLSFTVQNGTLNLKTNITSLMDTFAITILSKAPAITGTMQTIMNGMSNIVTSCGVQLRVAGINLMNNISIGMDSGRSYLFGSISSTCNSIIGKVRGYASQFKTAGTTLMTNMAIGMSSSTNTCSSTINSMLNSIRNSINAQGSAFRSAGANLMTQLGSGIRSNNVSSYAASMANNCVSAMRGTYWSWYSAGGYLVQGFANGISDYTYIATARSRAMANAANNAARNALGIHSPSRVGAEIGAFFVEGFANSIRDNMIDSTRQSTTMAEKAKEALSNALTDVSRVLEGDMDLNPVITPVVDLSNIKSIPNLFDDSYTANIATNVSRSLTPSRSGLPGDQSNAGKVYYTTVQNEFNITGTNAEEIADEVSRIIQLQVERRDAVWE